MGFLDHINVEDIENEASENVNSFKNEQTLTKQKYWITKLEKAAETLFKKKTAVLELAPRDLNPLVCQFLMSLKREQGGEYEPTSIHNFLAC